MCWPTDLIALAVSNKTLLTVDRVLGSIFEAPARWASSSQRIPPEGLSLTFMSPDAKATGKTKFKISTSEFIAGLALVTKVLEQAAKSFRPDWTAFISAAGFLSIALLFGSIVLWLHSSAQRLAKVDQIANRVEQIYTELEQVDRMARYGSTGALVNNLYGLHNTMSIRAHVQAGGLTFSPLLFDDIPKAVKDFYNLQRGDQRELKIKDQHIVDNFLWHFIKQLPRGSNWFGISRLQSAEAWEKQTANVAYIEFQNAVEKRTKNREINYFRLVCFDDELHRESMEPILRQQQTADLCLRYLIGGPPLDDISMIWVPRRVLTEAAVISGCDSPIEAMEAHSDAFEPLCGIRFQTRGGRELDEMTIYSPVTDEFREMQQRFTRNWKNAKEFTRSTGGQITNRA